ncbi:MAG: anthranilate synthase component II [bacterium]
MILMIDNYDSFTYNLVQYCGELQQEIIVYRNDRISLDEVKKLKPERIIISPGPGVPEKAGVCVDVIKRFGSHIPILGVCLGHQCIAYAYGAEIVRARRLMHGKSSHIYHDKQSIFKGLKNPFEAIRYHSLIVSSASLPACLKVTAKTQEGEIMGIRHATYPMEGVQFHPESILTEHGKKLLENFLVENI